MRDVVRRRLVVSRGIARRPTEAEIAAGTSPYSRIPNGTEEGEIEIEIDITGLFRTLGARALSSKGNKAVEAGGLVSARVVAGSRRHIPKGGAE